MGDVGDSQGSARPALSDRRWVAWFVLRVVAYFCLLLAVVPSAFYPPFFRACGNLLFGDSGSGRVTRFEPFDDPLRMRDTRIQAGRLEGGVPVYRSSVSVNSVRDGYVPLAVVVALVLATPVAWRRRLPALAVGLIGVQGFVICRLGATLFYGFARTSAGDRNLLDVSAPTLWALRRMEQILAGDLHMTYVFPLLVWMAVLIRPQDLRPRANPSGRRRSS